MPLSPYDVMGYQCDKTIRQLGIRPKVFKKIKTVNMVKQTLPQGL